MSVAATLPLDGSPGPQPCWRANTILACGCIALLLALADKYAQPFRVTCLWVITGVLAILEFLPAQPIAHAPARRAVLTLGGFAVSLLIGAALASAFHHAAAGEIWHNFLTSGTWAAWLAVLWLYLPALTCASAPTPAPLRRLHLCFFLFTCGCLWACFTSIKPGRSFLYFPLEIGIYAPLLLLFTRELHGEAALRARATRAALSIITVATLLAFIVGSAYALGGEPLRQWVDARNDEFNLMVKREYTSPWEYVWRLQFPFGHHNRLAYFSMLAALIFAWLGITRRGRGRIAALLLLAISVADLLLTLNRGALIGLFAGLLLLFLLLAGRRAWLIFLLIPLAYPALPAMQRHRLHSLFETQTYEKSSSTVVTRLVHWHAAAVMIREYPLTGIGYSWKHFQQYYRDVIKAELGVDSEENVHAHNVWLQVAAEVGLPGATLFLIWNALRWAWLGALWRRRARLPHPCFHLLALWISLELTIQIFCFINLPLRRSLGVFTYLLWAMMLAHLAVLQTRLDCTPALPSAATK